MKKKNQATDIKRREFLKTSATIAAGSIFLTSGGLSLFGANGSLTIENSIPDVVLNNGVKMPILGFGTNRLNGDTGIQSISEAISVGYRLIDTAHIYGNEEAVGAAIKKSGIQRDKLFVTSKLWVSDFGYESAKKAFETSMNKLDLGYLDLYLLHRPHGDVKGSWKALEELYEQGKIKAIGVSNFDPDQLDDLMTIAKITPAVNQIESHVFFHQKEMYKDLKSRGIQMEAWSPFAAGRNNVFTNQTLAEIGKKYSKTNAQVSLRWQFQRGVVAIPRSSQKAHMIENLDIFDFELNGSDMRTIDSLDQNTTQFPEWR